MKSKSSVPGLSITDKKMDMFVHRRAEKDIVLAMATFAIRRKPPYGSPSTKNRLCAGSIAALRPHRQ
jgi:hypothetical protein